ncbi:NAD(P)/FAD-dependent oxidoreductase [Fulvivirga sediminis]|uniref:NADH:ubiquinone reductase (non-electrogenic) n=1 Tax=Fulvivirga sediminis TaxID=2803949 RepID=A0A937F3W1_9BACT|nr:NAD(P)/FAD-dependent oxidoreductase [Fulvivirga sediminis]MBL3655235.1 NAD(P)/FAD-dependent oxidoreductase [Fulvivirga sediminis]
MEELVLTEPNEETIVEEQAPKKVNVDLGVPKTQRKRLVIIGGGFAGIHLVKKLSKSSYQVVLIDKHNHHNFQPLLYQVATSGLEADSIAYPIRKVLSDHEDYHFRMGEAQEIKPHEHVLVTDKGSIAYDFLVIATGAKTNYFGMENVAKHAYPMKSVAQAMKLRNTILENYEKALLTNNLDEREELMNIVIAGGGPTGVEMAGALAEFKRYIMPADYPDLNIERSKIYLVELLPELLPPMSDEASKKSEEYLRKMGVIIKTETKIEDYDGQVVKTDKGDIPSRMLIWTGGVSAASIPGLPDEVMAKGGRIKCNGFGQVEGFERIYALGDVAQFHSEEFPKGHPQLAAVAVDQGEFLGKHFSRMHKGEDLKPYKYNNKGSMATVGRSKAVVDLPNWKFQGAFAWFVWLGVHLFSLIGFRNKIVTFTNWVSNYFSRDRHSRVIIKD